MRGRAAVPSQLSGVVARAANRLLFVVLGQNFAQRTVADVAVIHNGDGLRSDARDSAGTVDVFGSGGKVGSHTEHLHKGPFVVIGRKGSAGKITFARDGGWVTDTAYFTVPKPEALISCRYLFHALRALDFSKDVITTAIPGINRTAIYHHTIPVPPTPVS